MKVTAILRHKKRVLIFLVLWTGSLFGERVKKSRGEGSERVSTVSVPANSSLHQDLFHSGCRGTTVPNVCLRALPHYFSSPHKFFTLSPNKEPVHRLWSLQHASKTSVDYRTLEESKSSSVFILLWYFFEKVGSVCYNSHFLLTFYHLSEGLKFRPNY